MNPIHTAIDRDLTTIDTLDLTNLGRRLHAALTIELEHRSRPDGHPTKTIGAAAPTNTGRPTAPCNICDDTGYTTRLVDDQLVVDDCNDCGPVTLTSVETAATQRPPKDEYRDLVRHATGYLADAARALRASQHMLEKLDELRKNTRGMSTEPGCWAMDRIGAWEPIAHYVTIDGESRGLCEWAYKFARRVGRIPTMAECRKRSAGKRVMVAV